MSGRKSQLAFFVCLIAVVNIALGDEEAKEDAAKRPPVKVSVDAGIVPMPGDEIGILVQFDHPMDRNSRPTATLAIEKSKPQKITQGKWNADATVWTFDPVKLAAVEGMGRLIVAGAKTVDGPPLASHEEPFVVGRGIILAKLEEIGRWMLDHRHEFIFVEGYDYRTLLALYEITGKPEYLQAARKGANNLLRKQQPYGHWGTGYGTVYLADTGSALGLFINLYQFAAPEQRKKIDESLDRYCEMVLVKGDGTGKSFVHEDGSLGVGFRVIKNGKISRPENNPYSISTALTGAEVFAGLYYMHGKEQYKQLAVKACNWLLDTISDEGFFLYIFDDRDPKRANTKSILFGTSTYVGEGLIAAWTYLDDSELNRRIEAKMKSHVQWLIQTQNADGSWGEDKTFNSTRGHGVVNVLSWHYNHVEKDPRAAEALRRYYLLLLDKDRKSYCEVARHPIRKQDWSWAVAGEYVSTCLAGRALAEIVKPDVDCYRWKDKPAERTVCEPPPIKTEWDDLLAGVKTRQDWEVKRKILWKRFLELIGDDAKPSQKPPLDLEVHESVDVEGLYTRKLISYNVESDERATAYLAVPVGIKKGERRAAVVVSHGTAIEGKDVAAGFMPRPRHKGQGFLDELARRDYVVIAPDCFNMGQRLPPGGVYHTDVLYQRHPRWSAMGKIVFDGSIAVDVLETLDYVDVERIGTMGHSLGGTATIYLAAYDPRIAAAACNDGSYPFRFSTEYKSRYLNYRPGSTFLYFKNLAPLIIADKLPPIDVHEIIALVAPRPFLDNVSTNDVYGGSAAAHRQRVLMDLRLTDVWALTGAAANFAFYVRTQGHSCQHDNNELMFAWLDKHLGSPRADLSRKVRK